LAAHLALRGIAVWAVLPGRHRNRGGVQRWETARQDITRTLRERRYCSTMFDYYAMPEDWPGRTQAKNLPWHDRASFVEKEIHASIAASMDNRFNPSQFIPYVQLHEFEALAFSDIDALVAVLTPLGSQTAQTLHQQFRKILDSAGHPEAIDDGYLTSPARRIAGLAPAYKKRAHGPIIAKRIGLDSLRTSCTHFGNWLTRLEAIGT
jgi:hypothetical protein